LNLLRVVVGVLMGVVSNEVLGPAMGAMAHEIDQNDDGALTLGEVASFVNQGRECVDGPEMVSGLRCFVKAGQSSLSTKNRNEIRGKTQHLRMLGMACIEALDPQGVSIDEFESMIGEMHEGMVELVFAMVPPLPDSALSARLRHLCGPIKAGSETLKEKIIEAPGPVVNAYFNMLDRDSSGMVSEKEFTGAVNLLNTDATNEQMTKTFFEILDKDGNGELSVDELKEVLELLVDVVGVGVLSVLDASSVAVLDGSLDELLLGFVSQYIGANELHASDAVRVYKDFSVDMVQMASVLV